MGENGERESTKTQEEGVGRETTEDVNFLYEICGKKTFFHTTLCHGTFRNLLENKCTQCDPKDAARFKLRAYWPCLPEALKQLALVHSEALH